MDVAFASGTWRIIRCIAILTVVLVTPAAAQSESEAFASTYLQRTIGARALGLGSAYTSAVNEPNAIFINPGALSTQSENVVISTMFSSLSFGRYHGTLAATQNLSRDFGVGVGFNSFTAGTFTRRDALGNDLGSASYQHYSANIGAGYTISSFGFGVVAKYIQSSLSGEGLSSSGFGFDAGVKVPFSNLFTFGLAVQNIGSIHWNNSSSLSETLPWVLRSGISTEIALSKEQYVVRSTSLGEADTVVSPSSRYVLLSLECDYFKGAACPQISLGAEYALSELFAIRGGLAVVGDNYGVTSFLPMNSFGGGISYRLHAPELPVQLQLDYAASRDFSSAAGVSHYFSLIVGL